ncbi:MAG: hypothetical protein MUF83_04340 [Acidimicrobiales bacterium]|jgi:hypothetical protein|nr:hypothetical protein [Acidimicrobiales bacterium]
MDGRCTRHQFEQAEGTCRNCGFEFCSECLVFAFGPDKPPYCIPCALAASGVRANTSQPRMSRREVRRRDKERRRADKAAARQGHGSTSPTEVTPAPVAPARPSGLSVDDAGEVVPF